MKIAQLFASCFFLMAFGVVGAAAARQSLSNSLRRPIWPVLEWSVAWLGAFAGSWIILAVGLILTSSALFHPRIIAILFWFGGGMTASYVEVICLVLECAQRRSWPRRTLFWMLAFGALGSAFAIVYVVFRLNYDLPRSPW